MRDAALQGVAVGFFDGVHLGHRRILEGVGSVLTFRNHPLSVLAPERAPRFVMSREDRLAALADGGRTVEALDFTRELAAMPPEDFAARYLRGRRVRCGSNWRFGADGKGDAVLLRSLGYDVEVVPSAVFEGGTVSSTRIRAALGHGDIAAANAMLGRPWSWCGTAHPGKGLGATIGFPTVNVSLDGLSLDLPRGAYAVTVGDAAGVANWGLAPTLGERAWKSPVLEIHFIGETNSVSAHFGEMRPRRVDTPSGETRPAEIRVAFHRFLRPERRFGSLEGLRRQIAADCAVARSVRIPPARTSQPPDGA